MTRIRLGAGPSSSPVREGTPEYPTALILLPFRERLSRQEKWAGTWTKY